MGPSKSRRGGEAEVVEDFDEGRREGGGYGILVAGVEYLRGVRENAYSFSAPSKFRHRLKTLTSSAILFYSVFCVVWVVLYSSTAARRTKCQ